MPALADIANDLRRLGDLGYEGEADTSTIAFRKPKNGQLTGEQQMFNKAHNGLRAIGERGNALLKMTFKALRNVGLNPWRIGDIVAAALGPSPHRTHPHHMTAISSQLVARNGSVPALSSPNETTTAVSDAPHRTVQAPPSGVLSPAWATHYTNSAANQRLSTLEPHDIMPT